MSQGPVPAGGGNLRSVLRSGRFAVTAEIGPPRGAAPEVIRSRADLLRGWVDAVNITDNQSAFVRMSSFGGSLLAMQSGIEPVMQLTCRDRNRIALQSDLISAGALGIPNVLLLTGDHTRFGDHPDAKPVFDLDSTQLVWTARTLRDEGVLMSGRPLGQAPNWLIGAVENPFAPPQEFRARRLAKKVAAGAEFVQTQFVFDLDVFESWMNQLNDLGVTERCSIIAGVGPVRSLRALDHMEHSVPGIWIPPDVDRRLRSVPEAAVEEEGLAICVETIERLKGLRGVAGVHVMAYGFERGIPDILTRSGLAPRDRLGESAELVDPAPLVETSEGNRAH